MRLSPYVVLPVLSMALALAVAVWFGETMAGNWWTGQAFPVMCGS